MPTNEPVLDYRRAPPSAGDLRAELARLAGETLEIAPRIGGRAVRTGTQRPRSVVPHGHAHVLATWHQAGEAEVGRAIDAALDAHHDWSRMAWDERAAIFLQRRRPARRARGACVLNAATMLGQSKTALPGRDRRRLRADRLLALQRALHASRSIASSRSRRPACGTGSSTAPLEGFVFAVTPFNFTSIAGNLPTAPALMGNTVVWKPASTAVYSAHVIMELLEAAGLPPGVINMVPGSGADVGDPVLASPHLAGIHFTGSTARVPGDVGDASAATSRATALPAHRRRDRRQGLRLRPRRRPTWTRSRPRSCAARSSTRGRSARPRRARTFRRRCGRASQERLLAQVAEIRMGDVADFTNFMGAVIDEHAFESITGYIDGARHSPDAKILARRRHATSARAGSSSRRWCRRSVPICQLMCEEIFGPVLTLLRLRRRASSTQTLDALRPRLAVRADRRDLRAATARRSRHMSDALRYAAGNFYINDKPTGRGGRPATVRRRARLGHERQGGQPAEPAALGQPAHDQGDLRPADDFRYPVPRRPVEGLKRARSSSLSAPMQVRRDAPRRCGASRCS